MLEIYADGACEPNPGRGGWGFVAYEGGAEIHTASGGQSNTTNNQMELLAIKRALEWAGEREARVWTDSNYCVKALTLWHQMWAKNGWKTGKKPNRSPVKNQELIRECLALLKPQHRLSWCKGHAGVVGNERADELASIGWRNGDAGGSAGAFGASFETSFVRGFAAAAPEQLAARQLRLAYTDMQATSRKWRGVAEMAEVFAALDRVGMAVGAQPSPMAV